MAFMLMLFGRQLHLPHLSPCRPSALADADLHNLAPVRTIPAFKAFYSKFFIYAVETMKTGLFPVSEM
jgi:hypothetical protein